MPVTAAPSTRCSSVALLRTLISSSTAALRDTTTLPRRRLSLMILTGMSCPTSESRLWMGRGSACEAGLNCNFAGTGLKLFNRYEAFGFVSEIDDYILAGYGQNGTLQDFVGGRRG